MFLYPTRTAGSSEDDPVIYVHDSILEPTRDKPDACDQMVEKSKGVPNRPLQPIAPTDDAPAER
jgi:hypothetical protein